VWTHPLTIAAIPAVATVIVGAFALFSSPDPPLQPKNTESSVDGGSTTQEGGVVFRVDPDLPEYGTGWWVAFDGPLPDTHDYPAGPPSYEKAYSWVSARGGVDVGESHLRMYLENEGKERVTIRSINAKVISRAEPIAVTEVVSPGAGTNDLVSLVFDLDSGDLVAARPEKLGAGRDVDTSEMPFFSTKNVTLDPGESTDIKITTKTDGCHCLYKFEVEMVRPDATNTLQIGGVGGRPFEITGPAERYSDTYQNGQLSCMTSGLFKTHDRVVDCNQPA
jgi:hypothetical protein